MSFSFASSRACEESGYTSCLQDSTNSDLTASFRDNSFLAISYRDFKLGITFYRMGSTKIELLHEVYEYYDFCHVKSILQKVEPTNVIISSKCDLKLVNFLKKVASNPTSDDEIVPNNTTETNISEYLIDDSSQISQILQFQLHIFSNRYFQYEQCKARILSMNLSQMVDMIDTKQRFIYLSSHIDFSEINTIKSFGVMLHFIEKNLPLLKLSAHIENDISKFEYINCYHVTMDQTTFEALEIFQQEWHPSTSKKGFYKKEGLSLFGIFNTCSSKVGSFRLKKIFQQPITDYDVLFERFEIIEYFMKSDNKILKNSLAEYLKNIKDIIPIMNRLEASVFQFTDFETLLSVVENMILIKNLILKTDIKLSLFSQVEQILNTEIEELRDCLDLAIDFSLSKVNNCIEIRNNVNYKLDETRLILNKLPKVLEATMLSEHEQEKFFNHSVVHISNAYIPQIGFLFSIPINKLQDFEDSDIDFIFSADNKAFLKGSLTAKFDQYYGDLFFEISDLSRNELLRLKTYILNRKKVLQSSISFCAQLDAMIAMTHAAINYNYVRPNLNVDGRMEIEGSRHPLFELISNAFTPNSYLSNDNESKTAIIFGPNNCGKSVFLKQVSLIVYLAHIGSFVPATYAAIGIVDQIFTRIRTPESISTQLSAFKHDLNQIIMATKYASSRSLVVIDYFGKGTLSVDGYSLLAACVNHWSRSLSRPHLVISSLFNLMSTISPSNVVKFYTFASFCPTVSNDNLSSFKLIECKHHELNDEIDLEFQNTSIIHSKTERIVSSDEFSIELKKTHKELATKFNEYIKIADCLINTFENENVSSQLSLLIQSIINKDTTADS